MKAAQDMTITIRPRRPAAVGEVLDGLAGLVEKLTQTELDKVGDAVRLGIAQNFTSESGGGVRWPPLAARTVRERRELGFAGEHPILQRTRQLKLSWTERGHPLHRQTVSRQGDEIVVEIASEDERSDRLSGGDILTNLPPRPIEELNDRQMARIAGTAVFVLEQAASRLGSR